MAFLRTSIAAVFDLDARIWRTLKYLISAPGTVSSDFISGRRVAHVHPVRIFLFVGVLAFALPHLVVFERLGLVHFFTVVIAASVNEEWGIWLVLLIAAPVMATALRVLYLQRDRRYLEHLIVALEFFSLVFLVAVAETTLVWVTDGTIGMRIAGGVLATGFLLWAGVTMLRKVYESSMVEALIGLVFLLTAFGTGILVVVLRWM